MQSMLIEPHSVPRVGIGVIVMHNGKVLIGKRKSKHGIGMWGFPGGHLEFGESLEACANRETLEETDITISNVRKGPYTNDVHVSEKRHYITIFLLADYASGDAKVMEPEKCEEWRWVPWDDLPDPLFLPITHLLEEKFNPFTP